MNVIVLNIIKSTEQMMGQLKKISMYHSFKKVLQLDLQCTRNILGLQLSFLNLEYCLLVSHITMLRITELLRLFMDAICRDSLNDQKWKQIEQTLQHL